MAVVVHKDPVSVDKRLVELGLSSEAITTVFQRADADRRGCTEFDPVSLPGLIFWGRVVRYLREEYVVTGWHWADPNQVPLLISPDRSFAITPSSGSSETGTAALNPTTRYAKGGAIIGRVQRNEQLVIEGFEAADEEVQHDTDPTWILLYRHTKNGDGLRLYAELSLPTGVNDGRRIDAWHERIILPVVDFEPLTMIGDDPGSLDEIDIPITRLG